MIKEGVIFLVFLFFANICYSQTLPPGIRYDTYEFKTLQIWPPSGSSFFSGRYTRDSNKPFKIFHIKYPFKGFCFLDPINNLVYVTEEYNRENILSEGFNMETDIFVDCFNEDAIGKRGKLVIARNGRYKSATAHTVSFIINVPGYPIGMQYICMDFIYNASFGE